MATFNSVLVNKGKGKLGDIVVSHWRGLKTLRGYVPHIKSAADPTVQLEYRNKMRMISKVAAIVRGYLPLIWSIRLRMKTEFSAFIQAFLKVMTVGALLDITKLQGYQLGNGHLAPVLPDTIAAVAGVSLTITWDPTLYPPTFPHTTATMDVFVIDEFVSRAKVYVTPTLFSAGTLTVVLDPDFFVGEGVFVMIGAKNIFTNPLTGNAYTQYSKFSGMQTAVFETLIA
jgi:hypothetical protein